MVEVESASVESIHMEDAVILALVITLVAVVALCGLMLNIVIYALPLTAGAALGMALHSAGYGIPASLFLGALGAIATLVLLQFAIGAARSPVFLAMIGLLVAAPATFAGYHFLLGLLRLFTPDAAFPNVLAGAGALAFGIAAWIKVPQFGHTHELA